MNAKEQKMFDEIQKVIYDYDEMFADAVSEGVFEWLSCGEFNTQDMDELEEQIRKHIYRQFAANLEPYEGYYSDIEALGEEYMEFYEEHEYEFDCRSGGNAYNPLDEGFAEEVFDRVWADVPANIPALDEKEFVEKIKEYEDCDTGYIMIGDDVLKDAGALVDFKYYNIVVIGIDEGYDGEHYYLEFKTRPTNEGEETNITPDVVEVCMKVVKNDVEDDVA